MQESPVVVNVTLSSDYMEDRWVARIRPLGISAYGRTKEAAEQVAEEMLAEAIQVHRELGNLGQWLNQRGVLWDWKDKFEVEDGREFKDVSIPPEKLPLLASLESRLSSTRAHVVAERREYALLAG